MTKTLSIQQPSMMKSTYLFRDGDNTVGQLVQTGIFRLNVSGSMDGQHWRFFKTSGLKGVDVVVVPKDSDTILATYHKPALRQTGSLQLNGAEYDLKVGIWRSRYTWTSKHEKDNEERQTLVTYNLGGFFKRSGTAELSDEALQLPGYQLLLVLGLYLGMDVEASNSAAASGATTAAVVATSSGA